MKPCVTLFMLSAESGAEALQSSLMSVDKSFYRDLDG